MLIRLFCLFLLVSLHTTSNAQADKTNNTTHHIELPALNFAKLKSESLAAAKQGTALEVGKVAPQNLIINTAEGWTLIGDEWTWQATISSTAPSLLFGFKNAYLPPSASITIRDSETQSILYYFDESNNKPHHELWTPLLTSSNASLVVKVKAQFRKHLKLELSSISQGYVTIGGAKSIQKQLKSGSCNIDVVCPEGDDWYDEIRSVVSYSYVRDGRVGLCTGTLVNNLSEDFTPYILSAAHCNVDAEVAPSVTLYWNFQTQTCGGTPSRKPNFDTPGLLTQVGAQVRASYTYVPGEIGDSDMLLFEMDELPPTEANAYYAGWNASPEIPSQVIAIHHPAGNEKRISQSATGITITDYAQEINDETLKFFRIPSWESGTTEGGSSGSAIWNESRQIVGTLSGGFAACTFSTSSEDNDRPDWYGRLAAHWEGGNTPETQLKAWLDPGNTGTLQIAGKNHCEQPSASFTASSSQVALNEEVIFEATVSGGSGADYTFDWDFDHDQQSDATTQSVRFTYTSFFQGNVLLTVSDGNGCSTRVSKAIIAGDPEPTPTPDNSGGGDNSQLMWLLLLLPFLTRARYLQK